MKNINLMDQIMDVLAETGEHETHVAVTDRTREVLFRQMKTKTKAKAEKDSGEQRFPACATMDLAALEATAAACTNCPLHESRTNLVFGDGDPEADLMFIGEAPGRDEDAQGVPFVGRSGQLLTRMIEAMQFRRSDVYIANIVKCRPPDNRNPEDSEASSCLPYLNRQIELINPKIIVLLGAVPLKHILGETGITALRGQWYEYLGVRTMPTFHPAYLLRNPATKKDVWEDLQKVMRELGRDPAKSVSR